MTTTCSPRCGRLGSVQATPQAKSSLIISRIPRTWAIRVDLAQGLENEHPADTAAVHFASQNHKGGGPGHYPRRRGSRIVPDAPRARDALLVSARGPTFPRTRTRKRPSSKRTARGGDGPFTVNLFIAVRGDRLQPVWKSRPLEKNSTDTFLHRHRLLKRRFHLISVRLRRFLDSLSP